VGKAEHLSIVLVSPVFHVEIIPCSVEAIGGRLLVVFAQAFCEDQKVGWSGQCVKRCTSDEKGRVMRRLTLGERDRFLGNV
jgi:hypothetical protein